MTIYLSENIKRLRREKDLTQETLAEFLGVTFQSVSNWERGESLPDITMLPEIASFFKVSVDELLGVNKAEDEAYIVSKIQEYDHLTDHTLMQAIVADLKEKYPNDYRVQIRQLACLVRFSKEKDAIFQEVHRLYNNIQQNCTDDRIRIKAKRAIIEYYRSLTDRKNSHITMADCRNIITELPDMRDCREMFCFYYDHDDPEYDRTIRQTLEEQFLLLHTVFSHTFFYDERFSDAWALEAFLKELDFLKFVYSDGHYGKMWRTVIYLHGFIGVRYNKLSDNRNALMYLQRMCELAQQFDRMERKTVMHSVLFDGNEFDKYTLGSTYVARSHVKELLTEKYPLSDEIKSSPQFKNMIDTLD
ncbi:MAG: helix-turn-helix transcriptional regulator [Clostridia bacterium]|nr:helix-turn-helix transcriptional regulator [Clostridia bacterium]